MSKVYVVQDSVGKRVHTAEEFGTMFVMLRHDETIKGEYRKVEQKLEKLLEDFDPKQDYLLMVGDPVASSLAFGILRDTYDKFRIMRWKRKTERYVPVTVELPWEN